MKLLLGSSLDDYINCGDETTRKLLEADGPLIQALKKYLDFFANTLWADTNALSPIPAVLSTNAFILFLSGIRTAMTGHASAIFPILRTALESACYAFVMVQDSSTEQIWIDRHKDEFERNALSEHEKRRQSGPGDVETSALHPRDQRGASGEAVELGFKPGLLEQLQVSSHIGRPIVGDR